MFGCEAAIRISENFKNFHPQIPSRNIIGQRNIMIYEYGKVKNERIWVVASERIRKLAASLKPLLPQATPDD